jgi:hypothetical protein
MPLSSTTAVLEGVLLEKPAETQTSIWLAHLVIAPNSRSGGHDFESLMQRDLCALTKSGKTLGDRSFSVSVFVLFDTFSPGNYNASKSDVKTTAEKPAKAGGRKTQRQRCQQEQGRIKQHRQQKHELGMPLAETMYERTLT